ncbi:hypothetical protein [Altericroceibacterium endophyticum]|uniref:Uncharacterized protein n=1 Tax=Altericroceibacterium endophyticum TaxID=1808508 RepID=A0A6I4T6Z0_9SPHN|nr:hypothetical protein [Altericroceibacterium endophyticum]MXO66249.1 hypothetical protein [Altericroceibacterium endophyticum]
MKLPGYMTRITIATYSDTETDENGFPIVTGSEPGVHINVPQDRISEELLAALDAAGYVIRPATPACEFAGGYPQHCLRFPDEAAAAEALTDLLTAVEP